MEYAFKSELNGIAFRIRSSEVTIVDEQRATINTSPHNRFAPHQITEHWESIEMMEFESIYLSVVEQIKEREEYIQEVHQAD